MSEAIENEYSAEEPDATALCAATDAVRRLIGHLRKTQASREMLTSVAAEANGIADRLAAYDHPGPYAQRRLVIHPENVPPDGESAGEYFPYSPVVGPCNAIAPPVEFRFEGNEVRAEHVFDAPYCGPPTGVHGGIVALVYDELLGSTGVFNQSGGFTGTLTIRYESITPLHRPIRMRAWIDRVEGRKTFIRGTMHDGETLCSTAEGVFIAPNPSMVPEAIAAARRGLTTPD